MKENPYKMEVGRVNCTGCIYYKHLNLDETCELRNNQNCKLSLGKGFTKGPNIKAAKYTILLNPSINC